jgi:iron-sulfur cluster repair protein YtfE (RIC family)
MTNPLNMIKEDHEKVKSMLGSYDGLSYEEKKKTAEKLSEELIIHMEMEEKHFYPKLENASPEAAELINESIGEHDEIKEHIRMVYKAEEESELDEHMDEIGEAVMHHVGEEESELFRLADEFLADDYAKIAAEMGGFKIRAKSEKLIEKFKEKF